MYCGLPGDLFVSEGVFAAAVLLVVEVQFADELVAAVLEAAFAPVLTPPGDSDGREGGVDGVASPAAGGIDLRQVFPAGRCKSGGEDGVAVLRGVTGGTEEAVLEARLAARAALGLVLEPQRRAAAPVCVLVIVIDDFEPERLRVARALVLSVPVLLEGEYIGVGVDRTTYKGLMWVYSNLEISIIRMPKYMEKVILYT